MSNNSRITNHLNMDAESAVFINSFFEEGRVFQDDYIYTTMSLEELADGISRLTFDRLEATTLSESTYSISIYGALEVLDIEDKGEFTKLRIRTLLSTLMSREIWEFLQSKNYSATRSEGVYDVKIDHFYLDKTDSAAGETKRVEHYRDTNSFNKLIPEMYPRINITEMMRQFSISDESILILSGKPGTGKTCVAKLMMAAHATTVEEDIHVVYVKDKELLARDNFWARLTEMEPDLLILDDLDNELLPRGKEGNAIVSNMLSYSDGIFDVSTKILITTNLTDSLIDKALVRPGRSFDTLCLPQLTRDEAISIWSGPLKSPKDAFDSRFGDMPTISQAALMSENQRYLKSGAPTYLLDPSISIRKLVEEGDTINHED